jgi:glycosyltransferase involved in cell wall biosynthesis
VLSVVVPTLGRSRVLPRALAALRAQRDAPEFEVVVVVDAAGDLPDEAPADTVLVARRPGASAARNEGIRAASGDVIVFLGDDILASPRLLGEHALWHDRLPAEHVAVLGLVERHGRSGAFERWLDRGIQSDYGAIEGGRAGWGQFYTTNVSVKKTFLERVGGFDEDLPFLYEDLDLGRRLHDEGMDLVYEPRARATHDHPGDARGLAGAHARDRGGRARVRRKHPRRGAVLPRPAVEGRRPVAPRAGARRPAGRGHRSSGAGAGSAGVGECGGVLRPAAVAGVPGGLGPKYSMTFAGAPPRSRSRGSGSSPPSSRRSTRACRGRR